MNSTVSVTICLGSNIPTKQQELQLALGWLCELMPTNRHTAPYTTPPEGNNAGDIDYLNAVFIGECNLTLETLTAMLKGYEYARGRRPEHKATISVIIDLDIVVYNHQIVRPEQKLTDYFSRGLLMLKNGDTPTL